jgi:C1A family cysteine protease
VEEIEATNRQGGLSYTLGENQFTDLTSEEFLATYTGRFVLPPDMTSNEEDDADAVITTRAGDVVEGHAMHGGNLSAVPESLDWREKGAVTPVRNQGACGKYDHHSLRSIFSKEILLSVFGKENMHSKCKLNNHANCVIY